MMSKKPTEVPHLLRQCKDRELYRLADEILTRWYEDDISLEQLQDDYNEKVITVLRHAIARLGKHLNAHGFDPNTLTGVTIGESRAFFYGRNAVIYGADTRDQTVCLRLTSDS